VQVGSAGISRTAVGLWGPPALYAAIIFWLSSRSVVQDVSLLPLWLQIDKVQHGIAYAGLSALCLRALADGRWSGVTLSRALAAIAVASVYGLSDEWHQSFVPERTAEAADLLADAAGATISATTLWACGIIRRRS
jgi:VanZ family protein